MNLSPRRDDVDGARRAARRTRVAGATGAALRPARLLAAMRTRVLVRTLGRTTRPVSSSFGFDRGTPIDRPYIEAFLGEHAADIRGHVLEIKDDTYARRFGGGRPSAIDVVDIDTDNPHVTLVADLNVPGSLPEGRYDCAIVTQVLQFLEPARALPVLYAALAPGGVLLLTVSALCRMETRDTDRWRIPPAGLRALIDSHLPAEAEAVVGGRGNAAAAAAFMLGLASEEIGRVALQPDDWRFPLVSFAAIRRPGAG